MLSLLETVTDRVAAEVRAERPTAYRSFKYELSTEAYGCGCMWSAH